MGNNKNKKTEKVTSKLNDEKTLTFRPDFAMIGKDDETIGVLGGLALSYLFQRAETEDTEWIEADVNEIGEATGLSLLSAFGAVETLREHGFVEAKEEVEGQSYRLNFEAIIEALKTLQSAEAGT